MEIIAISDRIAKRSPKGNPKKTDIKRSHRIGEKNDPPSAPRQASLEFEIGEIERAIYAKHRQKSRQPPLLAKLE